MAKKKTPPTEIPVPGKDPELNPLHVPEEPFEQPEEEPGRIPEEEPGEHPCEIPPPGEMG
ncbi:hypothetical protein [Pseudoflavitalea rhizosphaerae]|uniref:hypothetical protein n=1 Tax=Pseudoflavitalea rhizosphaerae TaxID=1884793 RepID=UPI000F8F3F6C|nr:hypothetical protein [Pseudoflavitalea rhizosphaerae]